MGKAKRLTSCGTYTKKLLCHTGESLPLSRLPFFVCMELWPLIHLADTLTSKTKLYIMK